jgi:hypothetical protein
MTPEEIEAHPSTQGLRTDGFLSPWIQAAILLVRERNRAWFDLVERANRVGQTLMNEVAAGCFVQRTHDPVPLAARLLIRSQSGVQAVVILAERGMAIEGEALVRGLYENAFWLGFLRAAPDEAANMIRVDELRSQVGRDRALLAQFDRVGGEATALRTMLETRIVQTQQALRGKPSKLGIEALAAKAELDDLYGFYKMLSSGAAHPSLHSLAKHLVMDADGTAAGHVFGPDAEGVERLLNLAIHAYLTCLAAFNGVWPYGARAGEVSTLFAEHSKLAGLEDGDAADQQR